jgi:hypothetical protein
MNNARLLLVASVMVVGSTLGRAAEPFILAEPPKPVAPVETANADTAPCAARGALCGLQERSCCEKFRAWLFYQPLSRPGPCGCCLPKPPCCTPPLYAFFLCHPGAAPIHEYQADCHERTCKHCGWHRKGCACEEQPKPAASADAELPRSPDQSRTAGPASDGLLTWEEPTREPPAATPHVLKQERPAK